MYLVRLSILNAFSVHHRQAAHYVQLIIKVILVPFVMLDMLTLSVLLAISLTINKVTFANPAQMYITNAYYALLFQLVLTAHLAI